MLMIRPWAVAKAQLRAFFMCLWHPRQQVTIMESQALRDSVVSAMDQVSVHRAR